MVPYQKQVLYSILCLIFTASACVFTFSEDDSNVRKIKIVYTDWTESVAITNLCKVILEERMDYHVDLKLTDVKNAYEELARDSADVFTDAWLPDTHKGYIQKYGDKIDRIGIIYPEARLGLVVPEYSKLRSIKDLKTFPHSIVGVDVGAGIMQKTLKAKSHYGFGSELMVSTDRIMTESLIDSIVRRKDIVVTGWMPHWIFARYEVRFLEDPDSIYGGLENICTLASRNFADKESAALRFFERFHLTRKQLNSLIYYIRIEQDPTEGVKKWIQKNEFVVNQWIKDLRKERKKIM